MKIKLNKVAARKLTVADIPTGEPFMLPDSEEVFIKIHPVESMFNSLMIKEVIYRGDCFVANLLTGLFTVFKADKPVIKADFIAVREE